MFNGRPADPPRAASAVEAIRADPTHESAADSLERHSPIAHRSEDGREHLLSEHLDQVGALARAFASKWGAESFGEIAGLLHDLGKYAPDFQVESMTEIVPPRVANL